MKMFILCVSVLAVACNSASQKQEQTTQVLNSDTVWQLPDTASYARFGKTKLSEYGFFVGKLSDLEPGQRVFHYDINSPLFSDYALKKRFIYLPEGKHINYKDTGPLGFPVGTTLIKNFYFDDGQLGRGKGRIVETRLLIKERDRWKSLPYVWDDKQSDAFLEIPGRDVPIKLVGKKKEMLYTVPTMLQCKSCHDTGGKIIPIGPTAKQLNKSGQLERLVQMDWLQGQPKKDEWPKMVSWEDESQSLAARAHAYLEINCGHCHKADGPAKNSGLNLTDASANPLAMGIYKAPVAAGKGSGGLMYDIVPGKPDQSILIFRMKSLDPAIMMPEIGKATVHDEGVQLIADWIAHMEQ